MYHRLRVYRSSRFARHPARLARCVPSCITSLIAVMAAGCAGDYAIGDLSERSLPVDGDPGSEQTGGGADEQADPFLASPEVNMTWRSIGGPTTGVGDIDGDGYDDFAVSGIDSANRTGYVHLRYGGPRPVEAPDQLALAESGVRLAFEENSPPIMAIDAAGDVNGDGFADMLVTAMVDCEDQLPGGGAYLLYGGPDRLDGVQRIGSVTTHLQPPKVDMAGVTCNTPNVAPLGLGDIDGDGLDDFVLTHYFYDPYAAEALTRTTGYVFYGREARLSSGTSWLDADATIVADQFFFTFPVGDVTADGRADFALGVELESYYWVPGSASRLSGELNAAADLAPLACADPGCTVPPVTRAGDIDGDGVDDVLSYETYARAHLFYGAPGLLDGGVLDLAESAASFGDELAQPKNLLLSPAGDRDGDGDSELLSLFYSDSAGARADVAFVSGSTARFDGPQPLPIQDAIAARPNGLPYGFLSSMVPRPNRVVFSAIDAGDLNGDGASEVLTTSMPLEGIDENGIHYANDPLVHIHYGTPGGDRAPTVY